MKKFLKQKTSPLSLFVGVLLVLLLMLLTLQYRWLGRISAGDRESMEANLRIKPSSFCEDFDSEITSAYSIFKMDADALRDEDGNKYAEHYDKWIKTAKHSQIVKSVFLAKAVEAGRFYLLRFNEAARAFEPIEWTPELEGLRRSFEKQKNSDSISKGGIDSIAEEIPALISPIATFKPVDKKSTLQQIDWQYPLGYIIITLDLDYMKKEYIPTLAKSYFLTGDTLDYNLTIISRNEPKKIIYQSNPETEDVENLPADASGKMLSISFDKVWSYSSKQIYETPKSSNQETPRFTLIIPETKDSEERAGKALLVDDSARWELRVNHRLGSLDAAVTNTRWRNLATSFGIFLLLIVSIIMIVILSRRMQKLAQQQIEFVAGVSHEFRTPLAVIYSLSENLAAGRISDKQQVALYGATIHKDVRRLTEMVEQVLEFAGAERGKHFYDKSPLDVGDLIQKVLAANNSLLQETGWSVEVEIEPNLPSVLADDAALSRAIQNLISNAMKYDGGKRWLRIKAYKNINLQNPEVNISIEDKGEGISSSDLPYIFEPFYRGKEVINAQIQGSGLGLNIVKKIIEAHGGKITVKSSRGQGSSFVLHLPVAMTNSKHITSSGL